MPRLIDIVIRGNDQSGPAFASAATNLARLTSAGQTGQASMLQFGAVAQNTGSQAALGLARVENQAHETGAAIITLGIAGSTTQTRMRSLTMSIQNQEDALQLAERRLHEVRSAHDENSLAVGRAQLAYDRLNRSLVNNRARMDDLRRSGDISGISVVGAGGGGVGGLAGIGGALRGAAGGVGSLAAGVGIGLGAQEAAQFIGQSLIQANAYARLDTTLRQLSGTQARYNDAIRVARGNQALYGGTLGDQVENLNALIPFLRTTNAELETLDQTTKLLAMRNQQQGIGGAAFALQEFLTSDTAEGGTSLAERFNLQRSALTDIIQQFPDDEEKRLVAVQNLLAQQGITADALKAQMAGPDAPFNQLSAAWQNFKLREGQAAQNLFGPGATMLSGALNAAMAPDLAGARAGGSQFMTGLRQEFGLDARPMAAGFPDAGQPTIVNNITVQGSLVTEREVANRTRALNAQTASRNRGSVRR
jgi:hypothetical protein